MCVLVDCLLLRPVGDAKWRKGRVSFNYRNVRPRPTTSKQRREHTAHAQPLQPACNAACTGADAPQKTNMPSQRALPAPAAAAGAGKRRAGTSGWSGTSSSCRTSLTSRRRLCCGGRQRRHAQSGRWSSGAGVGASDRSSRAASSGRRRVRVAHDERAALRRVQKGEGSSDAGAPRATAAP